VARGRPRSAYDPETDQPPIKLEEAKRRGLWAVHRVAEGFYTSCPAGHHSAGIFVAYAADKSAADRLCASKAEDERLQMAIVRVHVRLGPRIPRRVPA